MNWILRIASGLSQLGLTYPASRVLRVALRRAPQAPASLDLLINLAVAGNNAGWLSDLPWRSYKANPSCPRALLAAATLALKNDEIAGARSALALLHELYPELHGIRLAEEAMMDPQRNRTEGAYVASLHDVLVETECWSIIDGGKVYNWEAHKKNLSASLFVEDRESPDHKKYIFKLPGISRVIDAPCVHVGGDDNFSHWITRNLLKLSLLEDTGHAGLPLLINEDLKPYQREYLGLLEIEDDRLIKVPRHSVVRCRQLVVPTSLSVHHQMGRGIEWLCGRLQRYIDPGPPQDLLFISRRDSGVRRMLNESELAAALTQIGFSVIVPGEMTVKQQIARFSRARVIVGAHGAALANLVFVKPGSTVVEINSTALSQREFEIIAHRMKIGFKRIWSDDFDSSRLETHPPNIDFRVDVDEVLEALTGSI